MRILLTGKSGTGKTTLMQSLKIKNYINIESLVNKKFFVNGHPVFYKLIETYGMGIVAGDWINVKELEKITLADKYEFRRVSNFVMPYIKEYIGNIETDQIIEMKEFLNHQEYFSDMFSEIILVTDHKKPVDSRFDTINKFSDFKELEAKHHEMISTTVDNREKEFMRLLRKVWFEPVI